VHPVFEVQKFQLS